MLTFFESPTGNSNLEWTLAYQGVMKARLRLPTYLLLARPLFITLSTISLFQKEQALINSYLTQTQVIFNKIDVSFFPLKQKCG